MAISNSKPTQVLLVTFITFFLLQLNKANSSDDLSFNFSKFVPNQTDLLFQGDASVSSTGVLQVTKVDENGIPISWSVGRALYATPVQIWDNTTGREASFTTSFTFVVKAPDASKTADGIAFFLAPPDSQIPPGSTGGYLGLFNNQDYNSSNQIVAVEFDSYTNSWDPPGVLRHTGIDVNSIKSTKTVTWDWRNGEVAIVTITYLAPTKTLTVSLTYPFDQTSNIVTASVDLKFLLPQWVRVGFSAATGQTYDVVETHDVLSWSFTSTLKGNDYAAMENNMQIMRFTA